MFLANDFLQFANSEIEILLTHTGWEDFFQWTQ